MEDAGDLRKEVERWFKEDKKLLNDLYSTRSVLEIIDKLSKKEKSIVTQIADEMDVGKDTISKKKKKLLEHNLIYEEHRGWYTHRNTGCKVYDGKAKLLFLTEKGIQIIKYLKLFPIPPLKSPGPAPVTTEITSHKIPVSAKEFHSARIREVIRKLIEELPVVSTSDIYHSISAIPHSTYSGKKFHVEEEILFDDLKNHLEEYKKFNSAFNMFKRTCKEFQDKKHTIFETIKLDITKEFNLQFSTYWSISDSFSLSMVEWVYQAAINLLIKEKYFEHYYINFKSNVNTTIKDEKEVLEYYIGGLGLIQVDNGKYSADNFRRKIDKELRDYMSKLGKTPYINEVKANLEILQKVSDLKDEIEMILKENLEIPIFSGDCKYLRAMYESQNDE